MSLRKLAEKTRFLGAGLYQLQGYRHRSTKRKNIVRIRPIPLTPPYRTKPVLVKKSIQPILRKEDLHDPIHHANIYVPERAKTVQDDVLEHPDYFQVKPLVTMKKLYENRCYFGHHFSRRNDHMAPYLFGKRIKMDIIDLDQTIGMFHTALNFLAHVVYRGGIVLFVSRNRQNMYSVEKAALDCGEYSHCRNWIGGTFTNSERIFGTEVRLPDVVVFLNTLNNVTNQHVALLECAKMMIPTIGIVDSDCDPRIVSYPIPGNDDSPQSVQFYCEVFKETVIRAKERARLDGVKVDYDEDDDFNMRK